MNFQEAETRYRELEKIWAKGQLSAEAYREALANIRVNAHGGLWTPQEHTGRWFVYRGGQWTDGQAELDAARALARRQAAPVSQPAAHRPAPAQRGAKSIVLLIAGLFAACLVCLGLAGGGYLIYAGKFPLPPGMAGLLSQRTVQPATETKEAAQAEATAVVITMETVAINPDGAPHVDKHGVALTAPLDALEEGGQIQLTASDLDAPWRKAIEAAVSIDTPFYSLAAQGKNDTPGSLSLTFPANSPHARLLAVIDQEYLVELAQVPQDGTLTIQTRAGPTDKDQLSAPDGYDGTGTIYYTVITPKATSQPASGIHMISSRKQADERNCIPDLSILGGAAINLCRQNAAGTVQVMLPTTKRELVPQVDQMVDKIEAVMTTYYNLGFTTAQLSRSSPMLVRVSLKVTSPSYYPLNGVLYIPVDTVTRIAALSPTDVYHEMAHWIQAVKYSTRLAYWSGEKTWWLETAAENMVMLVEPGYISGNLTTYGTISNADNSLAFQSEPYQWPGDYYVQAQLVKVNMCDSPACPLSAASFAQAISEGTYPLMNGAKKSLVSNNLKDYAYYLLGKSPTTANSAISLSGPVKTGDGYGEYVRITRTNSTDLKYDNNGSEPQMRKESKDGKESLQIEAKLQRDGVYPLMVLGSEGNSPGLPVELVIDPGAPFYYTLDDGAFQYSDGSAELRLLPIHGAMGIRKVRIVAVGANGGEVFKARIQPLELQGAWVVAVAGQKTGGGMTCSGGEAGDVDNPDGIAELMAYIMTTTSGMGDMIAEPTGRGLDWSQVAARVPAEFNEANVTYQAAALLAGDGIKYQASIDLPKTSDQSSLPSTAVAASAVVVLPVIWFNRKRLPQKTIRIANNLLVITVLVLVSTGCFGMGMYGSATLDAKFQKIEYVGGQDTAVITVSNDIKATTSGTPLWKLTGVGTYNVTFMIEATVTDLDGNDTTTVETCTGSVTYPVTALVYKDAVINIPQE